MLELTSLPEEILSNVACQGDTKSALALAASCRRLREICYHPLTFKRLILTRLADPARQIPDPKVRAECCDRLETRCSEVGDWARYSLVEDVLTRALAPTSADQATESEGDAANFQRLADCQWAILSAKHPILYQIDSLKYIVAILIHSIKDSRGFPGILHLKTLLPFLIAATLNGVSNAYSRTFWSSVNQIHGWIRGWNEENWQEQITSSDLNIFFEIILKVADSCGEGFFGSSILDFLPDYLQDGLPFAAKVVANPSHHLRPGWYSQAINPHNIKFLTTGTWSGYYTYGVSQRGQRLDAPMRNVRFEVADSQVSQEVEEVRAVGCTDQCGGFDICLSVVKQTGKFRGKKNYFNGVTWPWSGLVTPFGLVGRWGNSVFMEGWIWLYKVQDDSV